MNINRLVESAMIKIAIKNDQSLKLQTWQVSTSSPHWLCQTNPTYTASYTLYCSFLLLTFDHYHVFYCISIISHHVASHHTPCISALHNKTVYQKGLSRPCIFYWFICGVVLIISWSYRHCGCITGHPLHLNIRLSWAHWTSSII